jgi:hypothetical protein
MFFPLVHPEYGDLFDKINLSNFPKNKSQKSLYLLGKVCLKDGLRSCQRHFTAD